MTRAYLEQAFIVWMIALTVAGPVASVIFWRRGKQRLAAKILIVLGILFLLEPGACMISLEVAGATGLIRL